MYTENNTTAVRSGGLSLGTIGFITWLVFLILKVTGNWDISWFWVWFPFWLPWAIVGAFLVIALICALIAAAIDNRL